MDHMICVCACMCAWADSVHVCAVCVHTVGACACMRVCMYVCTDSVPVCAMCVNFHVEFRGRGSSKREVGCEMLCGHIERICRSIANIEDPVEFRPNQCPASGHIAVQTWHSKACNPVR